VNHKKKKKIKRKQATNEFQIVGGGNEIMPPKILPTLENSDSDDFEEEFDLQEKENGKYYLGMYMNIQDVRIMSSGFLVGEKPLMFFGNAISTELFFKYKYSHVIKYMKSIIMCRNINPVIDIMQLKISEDGLYLAIIKTYWRNWLFLINFR
jgi:hypothetical protein